MSSFMSRTDDNRLGTVGRVPSFRWEDDAYGRTLVSAGRLGSLGPLFNVDDESTMQGRFPSPLQRTNSILKHNLNDSMDMASSMSRVDASANVLGKRKFSNGNNFVDITGSKDLVNFLLQTEQRDIVDHFMHSSGSRENKMALLQRTLSQGYGRANNFREEQSPAVANGSTAPNPSGNINMVNADGAIDTTDAVPTGVEFRQAPNEPNSFSLKFTHQLRMIEYFLSNILKVRQNDLGHYTRRMMESFMDNYLLGLISNCCGSPNQCPHGNLIPPADFIFRQSESQDRLSNLMHRSPEGSENLLQVVITQINLENPDAIRYLAFRNIVPGLCVFIQEHRHGTRIAGCFGDEVFLPSIAENVFAIPCNLDSLLSTSQSVHISHERQTNESVASNPITVSNLEGKIMNEHAQD